MGIINEEFNKAAEKQIRRWLRHPRNKPKSPPLVMKNERYFKKGFRKKFHVGQPLTEAFIQTGILQFSSNPKLKYKDFTSLDPKYIAEITRIGWKTDGLEILVKKEPWSFEVSKIFTPKEYIERLCNAYLGSFWYETFRNRYLKIHSFLGRSMPHIHEWQIIQRNSLGYLLSTDPSHTIIRLCDKGLIIPKHGFRFKNKSSNNLVHPEALAQFLTSLHETEFDKIYIPTSKNDFFNKMLNNLIETRLIPYMLKNKIHPTFSYDPSQASKKIRIEIERIKRARLHGRLPYERTDNPEKPLMKGIDLVLFTHRKPYKQRYSLEEIAERFAIKPEHVKELHLSPTPYETAYGAQSAVEPLYDEIARRIRATFIRIETLPLQESNFGIYIKEALNYYDCKEITELSGVLTDNT